MRKCKHFYYCAVNVKDSVCLSHEKSKSCAIYRTKLNTGIFASEAEMSRAISIKLDNIGYVLYTKYDATNISKIFDMWHFRPNGLAVKGTEILVLEYKNKGAGLLGLAQCMSNYLRLDKRTRILLGKKRYTIKYRLVLAEKDEHISELIKEFNLPIDLYRMSVTSGRLTPQ